jgi:AbrB family looped-hinge helix DNA binding protein
VIRVTAAIATISERGQIVIPKEIREELKLEKNSQLE